MEMKTDIDYTIIGNRVRDLRKAKKWTQAKLAEESGVEPSYISHIERGKTKVSLPTLICIVNALNVTLDDVVYINLQKSAHISIKMIDELLADCTPDEVSSLVEILKITKRVLRERKCYSTP